MPALLFHSTRPEKKVTRENFIFSDDGKSTHRLLHKTVQEITNRVAYGHRRISGPRFSPPENNYCYLYSSVLKYSPPYSKTCHKIYQNQNHFFYRCQYAVNSLGLYIFVKWVLRGLVNWGAYNRTKKAFQNKLHNSADQNTF